MSRRFDLAVIGGGPAGTSAAITAGRLGLNILLLEATSFPRHKVCGEFVSGEALNLLVHLTGDSRLFTNAPRISKARVFVGRSRADLPVAPEAASISRYDLDVALWNSAASAGCNVRDRTRVRSIDQSQDGFVIHLDSEDISARAVVNATGRWSNLTTYSLPAAQQWIGLKGHFFEPRSVQSCDLYFFDGGYCGVQPLGNGVVNVAAMVKASIAKNLGSVFALDRNLKERSRSWVPAADPVSTAPLIFRALRTSENGVLLAGDAAAFLDPFAGDGISIALHSGRLATQALGPFLSGNGTLPRALFQYEREYQRLICPALTSARRLRTLQRLPSAMRSAAVACLRIPFLARAAVETTRVRLAHP